MVEWYNRVALFCGSVVNVKRYNHSGVNGIGDKVTTKKHSTARCIHRTVYSIQVRASSRFLSCSGLFSGLSRALFREGTRKCYRREILVQETDRPQDTVLQLVVVGVIERCE